MVFKMEHLKALEDKLGVAVAKELNKLHEEVFPGKNAPKPVVEEAPKSEGDDD
jgi:hypothetical protein